MKQALAKAIKGLQYVEKSFSKLLSQADIQSLIKKLPPAVKQIIEIILQLGIFLLGGFLKILIYLLKEIYKLV